MKPIIKSHPATTLIGKSQTMTFANDLSVAMWQSFMPRRHEITNRLGEELYSAQVYPINFDFGMHTQFTKWASVPVNPNTTVPQGMEMLLIPEGLYAVFCYKGIPANAEPFFRSIFTEWLPASSYSLDHRPHFEILGAKYQHNSPDSEEEVWIPIKSK
ncbi:GyrI-like domain-containing protein [Flavobacterium phycosphaerae]|uniref:GyrI-like domain-containing protein n=1 Tax=Flavobacterium phycosphaerae TaxID=2697515 RepID=UPI00138ABD1B|nr:GyrI-like domain-containing protein [Flavobacterium phycosphaerae]